MADLRRCIGSTTFGIEAHEAPVEDFPRQPSQKDGLGRMCKPHWNQYTTALRKAALARKAGGTATTKAVSAKPAMRPVPKPAKKPARGRKTEGEQIVEAVDAAIARVAKPGAKPARGGTTPPTAEGVAKVRKAKALIDAIDVLPGPEHVAAIATDEAQAALEVLSEHA